MLLVHCFQLFSLSLPCTVHCIYLVHHIKEYTYLHNQYMISASKLTILLIHSHSRFFPLLQYTPPHSVCFFHIHKYNHTLDSVSCSLAQIPSHEVNPLSDHYPTVTRRQYRPPLSPKLCSFYRISSNGPDAFKLDLFR